MKYNLESYFNISLHILDLYIYISKLFEKHEFNVHTSSRL